MMKQPFLKESLSNIVSKLRSWLCTGGRMSRYKAVKATIRLKSAYYYESTDSDILTEIAQSHALL
jgi:hypothetical protein